MIRVRSYVNTLWKLTLISACAAMVVLWPDWRGSLQAVSYCNQGVGNGPEDCDPGNSNNRNPSNDERGGTPGNPGRRPSNR